MTDSAEVHLERKTDQWGADDFIAGPRVFTIRAVSDGKTEFGKYDIALVEGGDRVWRPPNTVLELLMKVWGTNKKADWVGRRVELYRDPSVRSPQGGVTGGIRVSAVSHIVKAEQAQVMVSKGKRNQITVQPLPDAPTPPTEQERVNKVLAAIRDTTTAQQLDNVWANVVKSGLDGVAGIVNAYDTKAQELA